MAWITQPLISPWAICRPITPLLPTERRREERRKGRREEERGKDENHKMQGGSDFIEYFTGKENRDESHHTAGKLSLQKSPFNIFVLLFQSALEINSDYSCPGLHSLQGPHPPPCEFSKACSVMHSLSQLEIFYFITPSLPLHPLTLLPQLSSGVQVPHNQRALGTRILADWEE